MEDRLQRRQVQTPISQLRAPVGGREGTVVSSEGEVATKEKGTNPSPPAGTTTEATPQSSKLNTNVTVTKYNTTADPALVNTALPASELRKGLPVEKPLAHENIPAINLRGLVDSDSHRQHDLQQDADDRIQQDLKRVQEDILRNAHAEKIVEDRAERDLKIDREDKKEGEISSKIIDKVERGSTEQSNNSILVEAERSASDKQTLTSFKDEPQSVFKSEVSEKQDTRAEFKNISMPHDRDIVSNDLGKDQKQNTEFHKNQISQLRDEPKIDLIKRDEVKVDQKATAHRSDQIVHEPLEIKTKVDAPKASTNDQGKQNLETKDSDAKPSQQKVIAEKHVEKVQEPTLINREVVDKVALDKKAVDPKANEPTREVQQRIKEPEAIKTTTTQPVYKEEPTPIRVTEQIQKTDQRVEVEKAPIQPTVDQPKEITREVPKELVREQHPTEQISKTSDPDITQIRGLTLEDRIEKIIVPDIKHPENVISREHAIQEEIIIDRVNKEAYLEKDLVHSKDDAEPTITREVLRSEDQQSAPIELKNIVEDATGIVVEKQGPNTSGESSEAPQAIVLEHEALDQIVDQINEVTPTASTSEGLVLSEVRGVISEIIRINDAQLTTGREPLPEELSRLEALSEQLRSTISQAVDELTRKVDKTYDEVVLLNELRVLLSELSRDPLIQLGMNVDDISLFESKEIQKPPQNMLEKAYDSVKEVVTRFLGFGGDEKLPEKQELPPPIIILKDKDIALLEKLEQEEIEEEIRKEMDEEEMESQASRSVHVLSGEIINSATGAGLSGVSVYGGLLGVAITDEFGRFSFRNVQHGTSFMIGPDKHGYKFSPSVVSGTMLNSEHYTFIAKKIG